MKKLYLFFSILLLSLQSFSANHPDELALEYYIDSVILVNDIDFQIAKNEFLSYSKKNYKGVDNIQEFIEFGKKKMKAKQKEFTKNFTKEFHELQAFALMSYKLLHPLEKKLFEIITHGSSGEQQELLTSFYIFLHEMNYWELNSYKPNQLAHRLDKFYALTGNFDLVEKLNLIILSAKIYKASYFVNPMHICESNYAKTDIIIDSDSLNLNTKNITIDSIPEGIKPPTFIGGTAMMNEYIRFNLKYPEKAIISNQEGQVLASFKVDESGYIYDTKIKKSPSEFLSKEVIRTIESMPQWKPDSETKKGAGFTKFTMPFTFTLPETN